MDKDGDGTIVEAELSVFFEQLGLEASFAPIVIRVFDRQRQNSLRFEDFVEYMEAMSDIDVNPRRFFKTVFNAIDLDGSNSLDSDELMRFAGLLHVKMSVEEAVSSIAEIDTDGNGTIDFDELCDALGI
jgi:Ca2+-binding EF-hand superfamily protein